MKPAVFPVALLSLLAFAGLAGGATPLGTTFSYQGRLADGGSPATGKYDLRFSLFDDKAAGIQIGATLTTNGVPVTNGLFIATLDFGGAAFVGDGRWLEISARSNGVVSFILLTPRQPLTASPYALYSPAAGAASTAGTAASANSVGVNGVGG